MADSAYSPLDAADDTCTDQFLQETGAIRSLVENAGFDYAVFASLDSESQQEILTSIDNRDGDGPAAGARSARVRHSSSALQEHNPRPLESYLDHVYSPGFSAGTRSALAGHSISALQEHGPRALASVLDYYYGLTEFKNKFIFHSSQRNWDGDTFGIQMQQHSTNLVNSI